MSTGKAGAARVGTGRRKALRAVFFVIAAFFILAGWQRGEVRTVFIKAATICLECIGIG